MDKIMEEVASKMNLKRMGPITYILGIKITRNMHNKTLTMTQDAYTNKVLSHFNMGECNPVATPEVPNQEDLWHDEKQQSSDQE
ncbi:hypothetical protein AeNC1_019310, partial [Aphanomyces euteiches]